MTISTDRLIAELRGVSLQHIRFAESLNMKTDQELNWKESLESWSILECLEHLNLYGDFYLPEIERSIASSKSQPAPVFKSGLLGNYFANSMLPKEKLNKMKTFKDKNPIHSKLDRKVITRFIDQQNTLIALMEKSKDVSLTITKVKISIAKWIRLRLGDTFRFIIYHNIRHVKQIERVEQKFKIARSQSSL